MSERHKRTVSFNARDHDLDDGVEVPDTMEIEAEITVLAAHASVADDLHGIASASIDGVRTGIERALIECGHTVDEFDEEPGSDGGSGVDTADSGSSNEENTTSEAVGDGGAVADSPGDDTATESPDEPQDAGGNTTESAVPEREGRPLPAGEDLDHTDIEHLEWAYGAYDSVADAAEEFSVSYSAVYNRLRKHGIHGTGDEDESSDDQDDDVDEASSPTPEPRSVDWDDLEPAVTDHDGPLLEEEEHADAEDSEEKAWPYQKLDESSLPARIGLVEVLDAVEQEGPGAWTSYVAAELGVSDEEARDALWLLELREPNGSKLLPDPELSEQIAEIREEVDQ